MSGECDRCGARARTQVILPSGGILSFCQHHTNQHEAALAAVGALVDAGTGVRL